MRRLALIVVALVIVVLATTGSAATDPTPQQQVAQLRQKLRNARLDLADANNQIDALNQAISDQGDTIQRLRNRLANQPSAIDVITNRDPDGLWAAAQAIWRAFPTLDAGSLCGYDKASTQSDGLTPTSITFYNWQTC